MLFTCGWAITAADEEAIALLPADARKPGVDQDGSPEEDKHVAEITHLMEPRREVGRRPAMGRPPRAALLAAGREPLQLLYGICAGRDAPGCRANGVTTPEGPAGERYPRAVTRAILGA